MNKFLSRVKGGRKVAAPTKKSVRERNQEDLDALEQFANDWHSLEEMRRKMRRSEMYAWGDQWGDLVRDPDTGQMITEGELIKKNGKVPLKNNMIAPIWNNIEGQCRTAQVKPVCVVRDQREAKLGEMVSIAVEYVHDINETGELDVATLKSNTTAGVMAQRIEYGVNPRNGKQDVWLYPVDPKRLFFDTSVEDPRMWDMTRVGELYDMTMEDVIATFGKFVPEQELRSIYGGGGNYLDSNALNGDKPVAAIQTAAVFQILQLLRQGIGGATFIAGGDDGVEPTAQGIILGHGQILQLQKACPEEHTFFHT